jgi:hypothetical protein
MLHKKSENTRTIQKVVQDNKAAADNLAKNSEPIAHCVLAVGMTTTQKAQALNLNNNSKENAQKSSDKPTTNNFDEHTTYYGLFNAWMDPTLIATELHEGLNKQITQVGKSDVYDWLQNCPASTPISLMMDCIVAQFEHRQPECTEPGLPNTASFLELQEHYN